MLRGKTGRNYYYATVWVSNLGEKLVRELKWREKQKVTIIKRGDTLIIKDWERK